MPTNNLFPTALTDLGFGGDALSKQTADEIEEQKRRKRLGLSPLADQSSSVRQLLGMGGMGGSGGFSLGGLR